VSTGRYALGAPGRIRIAVEDGGAVLFLDGEIDAATVTAYEGAPARDATFEGRVLAVDASGVTFFSSVGISFVLRMTEETRASGRRPVVRGATRPLVRILQLTGLEDLFDFLPPLS
jgi:anti-sigma B factor antagonist